MIITFCGHSQYTGTDEDERKILSFLEKTIGEKRAELYLGGYGAFDEFARKCGRKYQQAHPNTRLILVTPYITPDYQKNHLDLKKDLYDAILYPSLEHVPMKFAISHRNRWMVEQADWVVAHVDHAWGGAYQTYAYARKKKKPILHLTEKAI